MADRYGGYHPTRDSFGTKGAVVTPNNNTDFTDTPKAVQVTSIAGGDVLQVLPVKNGDGEWITYTGVWVGFSPGYRVRRVNTATTCTVATILD